MIPLKFPIQNPLRRRGSSRRFVIYALAALLIGLLIIPPPRELAVEYLRRLTGSRLAIGPWRDWDKPTDPRELEAYHLAHSIQLPDSLPKPVPFPFWKYWYFDHRRISYEYFQHLCKTEAGEYIFKTVDKVEGLYQMRPMPKRTEALMYDRYGFEDPANWSFGESVDSPNLFIGGPGNGFSFMESPRCPSQIFFSAFAKRWTIKRLDKEEPLGYWKYYGFDYTKSKNGGMAEQENKISSRYGYTWRGIRRDRDREFGIAGGEMMIIDLRTNELLAVRRSFAVAKNYRAIGLGWEFSYYCPGSLDILSDKKRKVNKINYPFDFIRQVLVPIGFDPSEIKRR